MSAALKKIRPYAGAAVSLSEASSAGASARAIGPRRRALEATSRASTLQPTVLLIEPDPCARSVMKVALSRDGFEVIAVENAEAALRQLTLSPLPSAVVSEVELPGLDGFALCSRLRAEQDCAQLPIILLSRRLDASQAQATDAGADDLVPKPVFARDVVSLVRLKTSARSLDGTIHAHTDGLPLAHLMRALLAGFRSGRVQLSGGRSEIAFRQGKVVDARFGEFRGSAALERALLLAEGEYTVTLGPSMMRATMSYGLRELVIGAFPRLKRWESLVARSVPVDARLVIDFAQLTASLAELPDGVNDVVRLFDGRRSVREVLIESGLSEVLALEVVTRLYTMGVIAPARDSDDDRPALRSVPRLFEPQRPEGPPLEEPSMVSAHEHRGLPIELARQLEAFRIQPVIEAPAQTSEAFGREHPELALFARGEAGRDAGPSPIPLTDVLEQPPIALTQVHSPPDPIEERFFSAQVRHLADPKASRKPVDPAAWVVAVALLSAGAGVVAWQLEAKPSPASPAGASAGPVIAAPSASLQAPRPPASPVPAEVAAEVLSPAAPVPAVPTLADGLALYDSGRPAEAAEVLMQVVDAQPSRVEAWLFLGLARFDAGDRFGAEDAAQRTLFLDAKNGRAVMLLASIYLEEGSRQKARVQLKRYLELEPKGSFAADARKLLSSN